MFEVSFQRTLNHPSISSNRDEIVKISYFITSHYPDVSWDPLQIPYFWRVFTSFIRRLQNWLDESLLVQLDLILTQVVDMQWTISETNCYNWFTHREPLGARDFLLGVVHHFWRHWILRLPHTNCTIPGLWLIFNFVFLLSVPSQ